MLSVIISCTRPSELYNCCIDDNTGQEVILHYPTVIFNVSTSFGLKRHGVALSLCTHLCMGKSPFHVEKHLVRRVRESLVADWSCRHGWFEVLLSETRTIDNSLPTHSSPSTKPQTNMPRTTETASFKVRFTLWYRTFSHCWPLIRHISIGQFNHTMIRVKDPQASLKFYQDVSFWWPQQPSFTRSRQILGMELYDSEEWCTLSPILVAISSWLRTRVQRFHSLLPGL